MKPLNFKNSQAFRDWLIENHDTSEGKHIYIYKKGHHHKGINYEDAVCTALCYGWIDAVTHACDDEKFIQYFARRRKKSHWSISNIKRMKKMIHSGQMTEVGLKMFDLNLIKQLPELEKKASGTPSVPDYFIEILVQFHMLDAFEALSHSVQKRYIYYIKDAKHMETKIRRCHKIIDILNGGINNL
jgi:uncharacterized protein YdeI (YjbR/CyaY-like superfamily)